MEKKIGFIGLGVMGKSMAGHILDAGYELYVYNRTRAKADELVSRGAVWCSSPAELASKSDIIITIVGYPEDVRQVYLGKNGIAGAISEGKIAIDMTTTRPSLMLEIDSVLREKKAFFADAPVSGGDKGASPVSMGQQTKMCNQIVIAGTMIGVSEALVYAAKCGLDVEAMVNTIRPGAAGCWTLDNLAPRVIRGDFEPGFMIEHFIKDMGLALEEAERMELCLPGLALVKQLYTALKAQGLGRKGTQALVKALESICRESFF